jgi:hypothetical protein
MSTENRRTQHADSDPGQSGLRAGSDEQAARQRWLWWVISASELLTFASSWIALWLTLEVVPADVGITEGNPVTNGLLGWSTPGLAVFAVCTIAVAMGTLRAAEERVTRRSSVLVLAMGAGAVSAISLVDAGWNVLLLTETGVVGAVGVPGPAATVFGLGAVAYLGAVHLLFHRRERTRSPDLAS